MVRKQEKQEKVTFLLSIASFAIALSSFFIAIYSNSIASKANSIAVEANTLIEETNRIAEQSNTIALLSINPNLKIESSSNFIPFSSYGCKWSDINQYQIQSIAYFDLIFSNTGGAPTSLVKVEVADSEFDWFFSVLDDDNQSIDLPLDIPAGLSRKFHFRAKTIVASGDSKQAINSNENFMATVGNNLIWTFHFNNGETLTWNTLLTYHGIPAFNFSSECR